MTPYHFKECGLPNVILKNGFTLEGDGEEQTVTIIRIDNLHKAIGMALTEATQYRQLNQAQVKFIRTELGLTQAELAKLTGVLDITAITWELSETIPHAAEALLRLLYLEHANGHIDVTEFLTEFANRRDDISKFAAEPDLTFTYYTTLGWTNLKFTD